MSGELDVFNKPLPVLFGDLSAILISEVVTRVNFFWQIAPVTKSAVTIVLESWLSGSSFVSREVLFRLFGLLKCVEICRSIFD